MARLASCTLFVAPLWYRDILLPPLFSPSFQAMETYSGPGPVRVCSLLVGRVEMDIVILLVSAR